MGEIIVTKPIFAALIFSGIGIVILYICFILFDKITPGNLWKEIVEEQNIALAIATGAMTLAMAQIIAAAIHG
jgi:putative membrane protein